MALIILKRVKRNLKSTICSPNQHCTRAPVPNGVHACLRAWCWEPSPNIVLGPRGLKGVPRGLQVPLVNDWPVIYQYQLVVFLCFPGPSSPHASRVNRPIHTVRHHDCILNVCDDFGTEAMHLQQICNTFCLIWLWPVWPTWPYVRMGLLECADGQLVADCASTEPHWDRHEDLDEGLESIW